MLLGAAHTRTRAQRHFSVDLVWTGPMTPFVATRRTEQVLLDVIQKAERELFIVSFVAYDVLSVIAAINSAIDRGVDTRILVEASLTQGGSLLVDPVSTMRNAVPSARLYVWIDRPYPFAMVGFTNWRDHCGGTLDGDGNDLVVADIRGAELRRAAAFARDGERPCQLSGENSPELLYSAVRPAALNRKLGKEADIDRAKLPTCERCVYPPKTPQIPSENNYFDPKTLKPLALPRGIEPLFQP
jgi:hypothetical protein